MRTDMSESMTGYNGMNDMTDDERDIPGIALAFLAGAIAGAVVAVLLAPKSGRELRENLGDFAGDMKDKVGRVSQTVRDRAGDWIDRGAEAVKAAQRAYRDVAGGTGMGPGSETNPNPVGSSATGGSGMTGGTSTGGMRSTSTGGGMNPRSTTPNPSTNPGQGGRP